MEKNIQLDKIRGSLVGGAIGDALGYPVEFISSYLGIQRQYGLNGITEYDVDSALDVALISDDTQMTLFTACGLLNAKPLIKEPKYAICYAYLEWLNTQRGKKKLRNPECWIYNLPELHSCRAPGNTCINSLAAIASGKEPCNNSKGCGCIMRTAPVALYGAIDKRLSITETMRLAAETAEITHQHPLGWLPSALEAALIYRLIHNERPTIEDFKIYLNEGYDILMELYPNEKKSIDIMGDLNDKALSLVDSPLSDVENIATIGEGWTAEETLAIALYCTAKYFNSSFDGIRTIFEKAMIASVNHGGDSDSTGTVTGNILGAVVGYEAIPQHFKDKLELHDVILHIADDLLRGEHTKFNK